MVETRLFPTFFSKALIVTPGPAQADKLKQLFLFNTSKQLSVSVENAHAAGHLAEKVGFTALGLRA